MQVKCAHQKMLPIKELREKFHPKNRNEHPPEQIERLAKILKFQGIRRPVQLSNLSGKVVVGHGMILAAEYNGWTELPVDIQEYETEEQEYAHVQADNAIASWSDLNLSDIKIDLKGLDDQFDWELLGIKYLNLEPTSDGPDENNPTMSEKFLEPPFSVLNARGGRWQDRKREWVALGIKSELGRGNNEETASDKSQEKLNSFKKTLGARSSNLDVESGHAYRRGKQGETRTKKTLGATPPQPKRPLQKNEE